jgi:rRNA processing protein Gar1
MNEDKRVETDDVLTLADGTDPKAQGFLEWAKGTSPYHYSKAFSCGIVGILWNGNLQVVYAKGTENHGEVYDIIGNLEEAGIIQLRKDIVNKLMIEKALKQAKETEEADDKEKERKAKAEAKKKEDSERLLLFNIVDRGEPKWLEVGKKLVLKGGIGTDAYIEFERKDVKAIDRHKISDAAHSICRTVDIPERKADIEVGEEPNYQKEYLVITDGRFIIKGWIRF